MTRTRVVAAFAAAAILGGCTSTPPPKPPERPVPGGTLRVSVRDLASLDPARAAGRGGLTAAAALYEPLVRYDAATGTLRPGVAKAWASNDGKIWRFRLGSSRFWDGKPVTAADVKFGLDRIARRDVRADAAFLLERVVGFRQVRVIGDTQTLSGVVAVTPQIVDITLDRPFHDFPFLLAHPALVPLPVARYATAKALPAKPVGNGPYRATTFEPGMEARFVRNERYTGPSPYLDEIVLHADSTTDDGWRAFTKGEADLAEIPDRTLDPNPTQTGGAGPLWATLYLGTNLALTKYRDPVVRRALSQALDRDAIVAGVYDGEHAAATSLVPPGVRGSLAGGCATCRFDLDAARAVLRPRKLTVRVDHLDDARSIRLGALVVAQLRAAGVRASAKAYKRSAYEDLLRLGRHDLAQLGFPADVSSPDGVLAQQLLSGSVNNQVAFKDPRFDALITTARATKDAQQRLARYRRAEARALDLMPLIPLVSFRNRSAIAAHVRGLQIDGIGVFDARTVWLAKV